MPHRYQGVVALPVRPALQYRLSLMCPLACANTSLYEYTHVLLSYCTLLRSIGM